MAADDLESVLRQLEQSRVEDCAQGIEGQGVHDIARYLDETEHMVVVDVLEIGCSMGDKGQRLRAFLSAEGYTAALESAHQGLIRIIKYARVVKGALHYDCPDVTL